MQMEIEIETKVLSSLWEKNVFAFWLVPISKALAMYDGRSR